MKPKGRRIKYKVGGKEVYMTLHLKEVTVPIEDVLKMENKQLYCDMCESGCKNFGKKLSCPPKSPAFNHYCKNYKNITVFLLYVHMHNFNYFGGNGYRKIIVANGILKCWLDKHIHKILRERPDVRLITSGSCRKCAKCGPDVCKKPLLRMFSFESLGINCTQLAQELFNHKILWYANKKIPKHTSILSGFMFN